MDHPIVVTDERGSPLSPPRTISRYITGVTTRLRKVEEMRPPMITQASGE
jgi:hypothetical protein